MSDFVPEFHPQEVAGFIHSRAQWYSMFSPADLDDLKQEGLIAAWQATKTYKPEKGIPFKSWVMKSIDFAMFENRFRGTWTGMPPRSKNGGSSVKHKDVMVADDNPIFEQLYVDDHSDQAVWAYHEAEIIEAIGKLRPEQQKYVYLRFWLGLRKSEIQEFFPQMRNPDSLWFTKITGARDKLRVGLSHLSVQTS